LAEFDREILSEIRKLAKEDTLSRFGGDLAGQITSGIERSGTRVTDGGAFDRFVSGASDAGGRLLSGSIEFAGGLATGTAKLSTISDTAAEALGKLPGTTGNFIGALAGYGSEMIKFAESSVDTLDGLSSSGASFNNNILQMNLAASQARLTLDEFAGMVGKNSQQLVALGGSVTKGAQEFSRMSSEFFDRGLGDDLVNMGFTFEEVNESLMNYAETNRRSMMRDEGFKSRANASAAAMAKEMDLVAKLTGVNRKELEGEIQDRMRQGQVQAKLRLLEMDGNYEAAEGFRKALAEAKKAGPDAVAALEETFTKGTVVSEAGRRGMVALGEAGNELTNVVRQINSGGAGVGPALDQFNAAIVERVNSRAFLQGASLGGMGGVADGMATVLENAGPYADAVAASQQGAIDENTSRQEILNAVKDMKASAIAEQEQRDGITETVRLANARMKDTYAAIGTALYDTNGIVTNLSSMLTNADVGGTLDDITRAQIQAVIDDLSGPLRNSSTQTAPTQDPSSVQVTPEQRAEIQEINSSMQAVAEEQAAAGQQVNEAANIINELLSGPNAVKALEELENLSPETTAQAEALKITSENNIEAAQALRDIVLAETNATAADRAGGGTLGTADVDAGNVGVANDVLNAYVGSQNTSDALQGGQARIDNFTVTGSADMPMPAVESMARNVETMTTNHAQAQTDFTTALGTVDTSLQGIPPALEGVQSATNTGLENLNNTLSTSMDNLARRIDALIEGQNAQTRTIRRTDTNLQ
jgi:hypothetical protein